jgi:hypothetical protein
MKMYFTNVGHSSVQFQSLYYISLNSVSFCDFIQQGQIHPCISITHDVCPLYGHMQCVSSRPDMTYYRTKAGDWTAHVVPVVYHYILDVLRIYT